MMVNKPYYWLNNMPVQKMLGCPQPKQGPTNPAPWDDHPPGSQPGGFTSRHRSTAAGHACHDYTYTLYENRMYI